jgi:cytoskeletal protein RodZ
MQKRRVLFSIISLLVLGGAVLLAWPSGLSGDAYAQQVDQPPPPPSKTPIDPPTDTPQPQPTNTPAPPTDTPQPQPTDTPQPEPTDTPAPPTDTPRPQPTDTSQPEPSATVKPPDDTQPEPNPACQSAVGGTVRNTAGQVVAGASVQIQGEGWSRGMLTDDQGHYGFAGLCAGEVTLNAALPGGQPLPATTVSLDGQNQTQVDLGGAAVAATATQTAKAPTSTAEPASTDEPGMPATGFPGWLLVGAACLGSFLVLSIGTLRAVRSRSRS